VVGVDMDPATAEASRRSGVYRQVYTAAAHDATVPSASCASAFANCALEHMDRLPDVLANIRRILRPGGAFLLSVVTEKWVEWATWPLLADLAGAPDRAAALRKHHEQYHHLA